MKRKHSVNLTRRSAPRAMSKADRFVLEYLKDFNGTQAAIRAGYSPRTAKAQASRRLTKVNTRRALHELAQRTLKSAQASVARVAQEYCHIAFFDPLAVLGANGKPRNLDQMTPEERRGLAAVRFNPAHEVDGNSLIPRLRFDGKLAALNALAKHYAMYTLRIADDPDYVSPSDLFPSPEGRGARGEVEGAESNGDGEGIPISALHDAIDEVERLKAAGDPEALAADEDNDTDLDEK